MIEQVEKKMKEDPKLHLKDRSEILKIFSVISYRSSLSASSRSDQKGGLEFDIL